MAPATNGSGLSLERPKPAHGSLFEGRCEPERGQRQLSRTTLITGGGLQHLI